MTQGDVITIGVVVGAQGIKGALKVRSYAESPEIFSPGEKIWVRRPDEDLEAREIEWVKPHGRGLVMGLTGVADRTAAEDYRGAELLIDRSVLPSLPEGTYYWADLIGLTVIDAGGRRLGRVTEILATGANDVFVVREGAEEILVPGTEEVVTDVDLASGTMRVFLPEGL